MAEHRKHKSYLHGAAVLAVGVAIVRVIGLVYRIPIANILGDAGNSIFGMAYSIYQTLLIVSTAGLPVALSRMISRSNTLGRGVEVKRIVGR